jgi:hypothetical protein
VTPESDDGDHGRPDDDADVGAPIEDLREVSWPLDGQFAVKVRGAIERRLLAGSILELFWIAPLTMLLEFLRWPLERLTDHRKQ